MITRSIRVAILAIAGLACVAPAHAGWIACILEGTKEFCSSVARDTKRRNCWPKPWVCPDRQAVQAPFAVMVANGWRLQNMLGDHHFAAVTGELTEAAHLKIRWILTEAPQQQRTIYVHRA